MDPIVARYGPFVLSAYTVWLGLGLLLALGLVAWMDRRDPRPGWPDAALAAAAGALLGGRALFVWMNAGYFGAHPNEGWQLWRGGLAYHGALAGGLLGLGLWSLAARRPFWPVAARLAPGLVVLAVFGWLACAAEGCAFGREVPIGGVPLVDVVAAELPDDLGIVTLRFRTQAAAALLSLAAFGLTFGALRKGAPAAAVFLLALAGISLARAAVAPFRGDVVPVVGGFRADLLVDAALGLAATAAAVVVLRRPSQTRGS
jgi:phosphatidylglycerol:prolipoprotein diacylglycerol transferase